MRRRWWPLDLRAFVIGFALAWLLFHWFGIGTERTAADFPAARGGADPALTESCPDAFGRFVGVHDGQVAVFAGSPEGCRVLLGVRPWTASDLQPFLWDDLERGIVFHEDDELFQIMEGLAAP